MSTSIILAAGEGTRMESKKSKVLHEILNKPVLEYVLDASVNAGIEKNIIVAGENKFQIEEKFSNRDLIIREQKIGDNIPYGTGYAVMQALDVIDDNEEIIILYGDTPLITSKTIKDFIDNHHENNFDASVLTAVIDEPSGYGRIIRDETGHVLRIVEDRDANKEEKEINEVNTGIYIFNGKLLKDTLENINNNNAQNEYYVTDAIGILKEEGHKVGGCIMANSTEMHGINSREQLANCTKIMAKRINNRHMDLGVTIIDPENTYIDENVKIGQDTIIYPNVRLEAGTNIGEDCIINGSTRIENSILGNNINIESSVILDSKIDDNTKIGPNAHIRPGSEIGKNVRIGNFVEVKNSKIGDNSSAAHLTYIGDSTIGERVNIGCGVVFANYDGKNKFRSKVGDDVFIGSNSTIISPVEIENKGFVAAGSTITKNIKSKSLVVARARQKEINNWVKD